MNESVRGKPVIPTRGPQESPEYSAYSKAKPLNVDAFGSKDARTRAFQALKEIEVQAKRGPDVFDDPEERTKLVDQIDALSKIVRDTIPRKK